MRLSIIGDDVERGRLEAQAKELGVLNVGEEHELRRVKFLGWLSQDACADYLRSADALVLPSLRACGGAVVLEAMAMSIPVIATSWGGPRDYIDSSCGILIEPSSKEGFVDDLATA